SRVQYEQERIALKQVQAEVAVGKKRVAAFQRTMKSQLGSLKAELAEQQSNLTLRQRQMDALTVKAGIAGVLQKVAVQEGEQVDAGTKLAQVARQDQLLARLNVPEVQAKD